MRQTSNWRTWGKSGGSSKRTSGSSNQSITTPSAHSSDSDYTPCGCELQRNASSESGEEPLYPDLTGLLQRTDDDTGDSDQDEFAVDGDEGGVNLNIQELSMGQHNGEWIDFPVTAKFIVQEPTVNHQLEDDEEHQPDLDALLEDEERILQEDTNYNISASSRPVISSSEIESYDYDTCPDDIFDDSSDEIWQGLDMSQFEISDEQSPTDTLGELPFWAQYEATRIALHCGVPLSNSELCKALSPYADQLNIACQAKDLQRSWQIALTEFASSYSPTIPSQRVSAPLWAFLQEGGWGKTVCMTGTIIYSTSGKSPFNIKLNPLTRQPSNRFWRKFGSDRFLTLRIRSAPSPRGLPHAMDSARKKKFAEKYYESVVEFISEEPGIELLGRTWKLFYLKDPQEKKDKKIADPYQAVLFATRGKGISPDQEWGVANLLNWHIPLVPTNLNTTVAKLWSRISLGFTKSQATVEFTTDKICPDPHNPRQHGEPHVPDETIRNLVNGNMGEDMNDGCSIASPAVFRKIQEMQGLKEAPSATQARIGGAKGLWMVDPTALKEISQGQRDADELWIRVNTSQQKYQQHQGPGTDPAWTTLDVLSCPHAPIAASVNLQLLAILDHGGVPFQPLRDLVDEYLESIIQELHQAMKDMVLLRNWVYTNSTLSNIRATTQIEYIGACPSTPAEKILMLLDAGFTPHTQAYVMTELTKMIEGFWEKLKEKMHIKIPLSTILCCVADPTGTLKEGEVSLHFSRGLEDPRTKRRPNYIEGDILVARNPAQLPSDIQKVRAVYNEQLRELKDVIVFSAQGLRSLASLLSGGDYDGDKCWICWDPRIVGPFESVEVPADLCNESEWFTKYEEKVYMLPTSRASGTPTRRQRSAGSPLLEGQERIAHAFIRAGSLYTLTSPPGMLGKYTECHKRVTRRFGLADPLSIELAQLCAKLVDAPKQGLLLMEDHENIRKKKLTQRGYHDNPNEKPTPADPEDENANIIARLDGFARAKIAAKKSEFDKVLETIAYVDEALTARIKTEDEVARSDPERKKCLEYLRKELYKIWDAWVSGGTAWSQRQMSQSSAPGSLSYRRDSQSTDAEGDVSFRDRVESCHADYFMIKPLPEGQTTKHPLILYWMQDADNPYSEWQLLKASAAYYKWNGNRNIVWYMAAQQLCFLKAKLSGNTRWIQGSIYASLKSERRFLRQRELDMEPYFSGELEGCDDSGAEDNAD